jgi:hypothetical protein
MPQAGYCAECGAHVWIDEAGNCANGHGAASVTEVYEAAPSGSIVATPPKQGLLTRLGQALGPGEAMTPAQVELRQAEMEHAQAVKAADKGLQSVTKTWDKALKDAESSLAAAQAFGTRHLGSYGGVALYEHAVVTPQGTINLEQEPASATVDTAGALVQTRRSTLTRMATGGILLGPVGILAGGMMKKKGAADTRELYLVVESASVASMVQCRPDDGSRVRQFAMQINNTSRSAPARAPQRAESAAQWSQHVETVRQQRAAAIDAAQATCGSIRSDMRRIDEATRAVASQTAPPQE